MTTTHAEVRELRPVSDRSRRVSLAQIELFDGLPERDLNLLDSRLGIVRWPRGAETPDALTRSEHVYLIREGRVGLFERTAAGHEVMVTILEAGSVYSTLGATPPASIEALENAAISPLSQRAIEGLITRYPRVGVNLAEIMSDRMATLRETVALVSEMRVEDRLRARLLQLAERFGITSGRGIELRLDLTHAQWATLVGASREAVTTAFSKLKSAEVVSIDGRDITLPWETVRGHRDDVAGAVG